MTLLDTSLPIILGLDVSSTNIGFARCQGRQVLAHGTITLRGDLIDRICLAETSFKALFARHAPDAVAYEGPTRTYQSSIIAQQRVVGVLLLTAQRAGLLAVEVAPASAKKVLSGAGNASKELMQRNAREYGVTGEHAADALGVALAAAPLVKVEVVER